MDEQIIFDKLCKCEDKLFMVVNTPMTEMQRGFEICQAIELLRSMELMIYKPGMSVEVKKKGKK